MFFRKKKDLIQVLLDRNVEYVKRSQAALDISVKKEAKYLDPLIQALKDDPEPSVRMNAAFALGELRMKGAFQPLITALKEDGSEWVRGFAASALANLDFNHMEVEEIIIKMLDKDRDPGARRHYAHSLGLIGTSEKAGPLLMSILENELDSGVRADAAEALGILGYSPAKKSIENASKNDINADVRRQANIALRKLSLDD
ncbi:MAG: HEAT repeat domain-containing protein [Candidatus Heimdallarchaeota archaeon]|nr:HEAT repeat domain-containing protein [Candidatus Heimdallarchaeota archaeon]